MNTKCRYIEIFRSTEQHLLRSIAQTEKIRSGAGSGDDGGGSDSGIGGNGSFGGGRNHPYNRNGGNIESRMREMRNMRNMRGSGGNYGRGKLILFKKESTKFTVHKCLKIICVFTC